MYDDFDDHAISEILLGAIFLAWGFLSYMGIFPGSVWIGFAGVFIIYSGVSHYYRTKYRAKLVANVLKSYPRTTLEQLEKETGISARHLRKIIAYLRAEGGLKATFDTETGELFVYEVDGIPVGHAAVYPATSISTQQIDMTATQPQISQQPPPELPSELKFCPYCGSTVPKAAKFCPYCGASLLQ
ncbi:MAG: zinc ribbon domain-containing protein [Candidatus Asgardarchaeia archaeon]